MAPYGSHLMCTAPIQCIWLPYNDRHLPYDNPKLPYGAYGSSLMPDDSHMVHTVQWDSTWCHMAPIWIIRLPQGTIHLPCGPIWSPYGAHGSNKAQIWFSRCTFGSHLPYGSHTVHAAPIWCMWLLCGICSSHMVHASPIWGTQLPYSTHGSHIEHTTPMWPSHGTCSLQMVPCASHTVPSTSKMAHTAPTQHTQLPYGPCMSRFAPR
jgi:hypothetical protein